MSKQSLLYLATLSCLLSTPLLGCSSTTDAGVVGADRKQLLLVSNDEILHMADQAYRQTIQEAKRQGRLDVNAAQVARLKRIAKRLILHTGIYRTDAANWQWQVHTIADDEVNAYVMPGGKIVFYSGIIERLNLSDDEIAAIMGHEMAHALREHTREQYSRQVATQLGIGLAAGYFGLSDGQTQAANLVGELGLSLPHSRAQETEADKIGLELMARAGYNPNAAITLWQKMQSLDGDTSLQFLSTHPSNKNRIATLQSLLPAVMPLYHSNLK